MISLSALAKKLEQKLNEESEDYKFVVHTGTGAFKFSEKVGNKVIEYVNCNLITTSSDVVELVDGTQLLTQNQALDLIIKLEDEEEDIEQEYADGESRVIQEGNIKKLENIRTYLNNIFSKVETNTIIENEGTDKETVYTVTTAYELLEDGSRDIVQGLGASFTMTAYVYHLIVENGINSRNFTFTIDGIVLPYQIFTVARVPAFESNIYAGAKTPNLKNLLVQNALQISLEVPVINNNSGNIIFSNILNGDYATHILSLGIQNVSGIIEVV